MTLDATDLAVPAPLTERLERFLSSRSRTTPYLVVDLDVVIDRYQSLRSSAPQLDVFYAVKALSGLPVVATLAQLGAAFDVASPAEIDLCLNVGVRPERMSYGNTVKKADDIGYAYERGIRIFSFDSVAELAKLCREAPGATLVCRLACDCEGAAWPLARKFGVDPSVAAGLLEQAHRSGHPVGVSFHVGSQQQNPQAWGEPLEMAARLFADLRGRGVEPVVLNIGGGFPASYRTACAPMDQYLDVITQTIASHRAFDGVRTICEPGRYLVADAGVIETEVVLVAERPTTQPTRWVYLDIGVYNGLGEVAGEAIRYHLRAPRPGPMSPVVLAGPTCDSTDILYQRNTYALPDDLRAGDRLQLMATGAYTSAYATSGFNGIAPVALHYLSPS